MHRHEDDPVEVFESTVFKPSVERRSNDSFVVLLMQQIHEKIDALDKKLTKHMTDETSELAQEIAKLMNNAFPGSDPMGHRKAHEAQMQAIADAAEFRKKMLFELTKWGLFGFLGWLAIVAWRAVIRGPMP